MDWRRDVTVCSVLNRIAFLLSVEYVVISNRNDGAILMTQVINRSSKRIFLNHFQVAVCLLKFPFNLIISVQVYFSQVINIASITIKPNKTKIHMAFIMIQNIC